jgi:hypothetical protein
MSTKVGSTICRLGVIAAVVAATLAAAGGGQAAPSGSEGSPPRTSFVGLIGDVSCDEPPLARSDAGLLVRLGLDAVAGSAPAQLLVTSVRGDAESTVQPSVVTLASNVEGAVPRSRAIAQQKQAVALGPLVHALTMSPSDRCGTDIVSAIRVLRDTAAGGTAARVGGPMTIVVDSNGVEVEQVGWERWYRAHPQADPASLVQTLIREGLAQDLHGVQIVWVGLGRVHRQLADGSFENVGVTNREYQALRRFWNDYVTACGGRQIRFFPTVSVLAGGAAR